VSAGDRIASVVDSTLGVHVVSEGVGEVASSCDALRNDVHEAIPFFERAREGVEGLSLASASCALLEVCFEYVAYVSVTRESDPNDEGEGDTVDDLLTPCGRWDERELCVYFVSLFAPPSSSSA
jgi:hypothetical protein